MVVYDPVAMDECRRRLGDIVEYASDLYEATDNADVLALLTEWKQFRLPDWEQVARRMRGTDIVDGRNIYERYDLARHHLTLHAIGRP